jgi:serine/threonine-protein kinase HipA
MENYNLNSIKVEYKGQEVGKLVWNDDLKTAQFAYYDSFIKTGIELSPYLMPLSKEIYSFQHLSKKTFKSLPPMFSDSLPDAFGSKIMNEWIKGIGLKTSDFNVLFRLSYVGKRGAGALEYLPIAKEFELPEKVNFDEVLKIVKRINLEKENVRVPVDTEDTNALNFLYGFGGSPGGARPKMVIALDREKREMFMGDMPPKTGMEYYLIKMSNDINVGSGDSPHYGKVEYAYYKMARDCGIDISDSFLWDGRHFYTKRFDRDNLGSKYHYQTFNSFFGIDFEEVREYSYEKFFKHLNELGLPQQDINEFYRRMCFNVISMNRDDHTKNHSLILNDDNKWRLAKAYDLCFSYEPNHAWVGEQCLSVNGKTDNIGIGDLLEVGERFAVKDPNLIIEKTMDVVADFTRYAQEAGVPNFLYEKMMGVILSQDVYNSNNQNQKFKI